MQEKIVALLIIQSLVLIERVGMRSMKDTIAPLVFLSKVILSYFLLISSRSFLWMDFSPRKTLILAHKSPISSPKNDFKSIVSIL